MATFEPLIALAKAVSLSAQASIVPWVVQPSEVRSSLDIEGAWTSVPNRVEQNTGSSLLIAPLPSKAAPYRPSHFSL